MPKLKTRKALGKRIKVTGGKKRKYLAKRPNQNHFRSIKKGRAKQLMRKNMKLPSEVSDNLKNSL